MRKMVYVVSLADFDDQPPDDGGSGGGSSSDGAGDN